MLFVCLSVFLIALASGQQEGDSCVDQHTSTLGKCKKLETCRSAKTDYEHSRIRPTVCSYSGFEIDLVCCRDGSSILQAAYDRNGDRPIWGTSPPADGRRVSERKCEEYSRDVVKKVDFVALVPDLEELSISVAQCDYTGNKLIVGGTTAETGEFPHMAAIGWVDFDDNYMFGCGGSLISPRFVLTAAHCIRNTNAKDPTPVIVRLGDQNIDNAVFDGADPIDVPIRNIHTHPDYRPPKVYNDLALFELASDVTFKAGIRAACLWTKPHFEDYENVIAIGWGVVNTDTKEAAKDLQKVSLSILENSQCDDLLRTVQSRRWRGMAATQMCAGRLEGGRDTCQGDSGSPLQVVSKDNRCIFHIVGVTSVGKSCAKEELPGVYTRVSSYIDWIEGIVWPGE